MCIRDSNKDELLINSKDQLNDPYISNEGDIRKNSSNTQDLNEQKKSKPNPNTVILLTQRNGKIIIDQFQEVIQSFI